MAIADPMIVWGRVNLHNTVKSDGLGASEDEESDGVGTTVEAAFRGVSLWLVDAMGRDLTLETPFFEAEGEMIFL